LIGLGQRLRDTGTDRGFTRSTLSGQNRDQFAHAIASSLFQIRNHYKGKTHKKQVQNKDFSKVFYQK
jgi:hypothetical protein